MELHIRKINLIEIPVEIRAGVYKHLAETTAYQLRLVSSQIKTEIERFYNFRELYLDDSRPQQTEAALKLRTKAVYVIKFLQPIHKSNLPLFKHPYTVRRLGINFLSAENYTILIREFGQYLKTIYFTTGSLLTLQGDTWIFPPFPQSAEHTNLLRNVETLYFNDLMHVETYNASSEINHIQAIFHLLQIPLSMLKLKSFTFSSNLRFKNWQDYFKAKTCILKIVEKQRDTLEELIVSIPINRQYFETPSIENVNLKSHDFKYASNIKDLSLNVTLDGFLEHAKYLLTQDFISILKCQVGLVSLGLSRMPVLNFFTLMEIVNRNTNTLERLVVYLEDNYIFNPTDRLDFSALSRCSKLKILSLAGYGYDNLEVVNFKLPKSVVPRSYNFVGFPVNHITQGPKPWILSIHGLGP